MELCSCLCTARLTRLSDPTSILYIIPLSSFVFDTRRRCFLLLIQARPGFIPRVVLLRRSVFCSFVLRRVDTVINDVSTFAPRFRHSKFVFAPLRSSPGRHCHKRRVVVCQRGPSLEASHSPFFILILVFVCLCASSPFSNIFGSRSRD